MPFLHPNPPVPGRPIIPPFRPCVYLPTPFNVPPSPPFPTLPSPFSTASVSSHPQPQLARSPIGVKSSSISGVWMASKISV
eukprot:1507571-Rhodomonas_salina.3